jgi:hypothetical protein
VWCRCGAGVVQVAGVQVGGAHHQAEALCVQGLCLQGLCLGALFVQGRRAYGCICMVQSMRMHGAEHEDMSAVQVASITENEGGSNYPYRCSKIAANMATKSMSIDLAPAGITSTILHPGYVRTDMTGAAGLIDVPESVQVRPEGSLCAASHILAHPHASGRLPRCSLATSTRTRASSACVIDATGRTAPLTCLRAFRVCWRCLRAASLSMASGTTPPAAICRGNPAHPLPAFCAFSLPPSHCTDSLPSSAASPCAARRRLCHRAFGGISCGVCAACMRLAQHACTLGLLRRGCAMQLRGGSRSSPLALPA